MPKLLTISIPTWNRSFLLNELLFELTDQIETFSLQGKIEILVSDNSSEDNTQEVVSNYQNRFAFIHSYKNITNIGAKSNVLKSMELASSEYVMFLGDDDRIRKNCLPEVIAILESNPEIGVLVDTCIYKLKQQLSKGYLELDKFLENLYWYMGNAGLFICKTNFFKNELNKRGYDFFNECWPQTQIMILGLYGYNLKTYIQDISIPTESKHDKVMVYSSYYLWRTCVYDLLKSINDIKSIVSENIYIACRIQMKTSIKQNFLNILQCGVFVDDFNLRKKTSFEILNNLNKFSAKEMLHLIIIAKALLLPGFISKPISNLFIYLMKGSAGVEKKNLFVKNELSKKQNAINSRGSMRMLEFEN